MKILFDAQSNNPDYNADCDYAVVNITPTLWEQVHRRVGIARQALQADGDLDELLFWGGTANFYAAQLIGACEEAVAAATEGTDEEKSAATSAWSAQLDDPGYALLPNGVDLDAHQPERIECDEMLLRCASGPGQPDFEVAWTAIPRHTDIRVTTRDLPLAALEAYVRNEFSSAKETHNE
jgi:hypothetical protein